MISRKPLFRLSIVFVLVAMLTGCGLTQKAGQGSSSLAKAIFLKKVDPFHLRLTARSALNADEGQMASTVEVRVWSLRNTASFTQATYQTLLNKAPETLENDLTGKPVIIRVTPGNTVDRDIPLSDDTQAVAIAVFFLSPDIRKDDWRIVIHRDEMDADDPSVVELRENHLLLRHKD